MTALRFFKTNSPPVQYVPDAVYFIGNGPGFDMRVTKADGTPLAPNGAGLQSFEFTQSSASATWTVNHNLGRWPSSVMVLSAGGVEIMADVTHVTVNQLIITFAAPRTGSARII